MPRSKSKAQRLAPPSSSSGAAIERDPDTDIDLTNHVSPNQYGEQFPERGTPQRRVSVHQPQKNSSPVSHVLKRRESFVDSPAMTAETEKEQTKPNARPDQSCKRSTGELSFIPFPRELANVNRSRADSVRTSMDTAARSHLVNAVMSPNIRRPSSPRSHASSDTASVALEDCIPELEEFDDIVLPGIDNRHNSYSRKSKKKLPALRVSRSRNSNSSFRIPSSSEVRATELSRSSKVVVADPTSSTLPIPAPEVCDAVRAENVDRQRKSTLTFLSDDEAKAAFDRLRGVDHELTDIDSANVDSSKPKRGNDKFGEYWKELETVSIRKSNHSKTGRPSSGHKRSRREADKAPCLQPRNERISSAKHGIYVQSGIGRKLEIDSRPITEENIDGGDAVFIDGAQKRKPLKRTRNIQHLFERISTKQKSQRHSSITREIGSGSGKKEGEMRLNATGEGAIAQGLYEDGEDTGGSTGFSESEGQACMQCGGRGKASKMVLCDTCSEGCHTFCMRPARASVPLGVWICPICHSVAKKHKVHLSRLEEFLDSHERVRK